MRVRGRDGLQCLVQVRGRHGLQFLVTVVCLLLISGCGAGSQPVGGGQSGNGSVSVIPAIGVENQYASILQQLGGTHVRVIAIITDPNTDPHEYETNPQDAKAFAAAKLIVANGAGYDTFVDKLVRAQPAVGRTIIRAADLVGVRAGDNPHVWYNPAAIPVVAKAITTALKALDQADSAYFDQQAGEFEQSLSPYRAHIAEIKRKYSGVRIAATENIVAPLAEATGLALVSPAAFMQAVAEGNDPSVREVAFFYDLIKNKGFKVLIYNTQTITPVTTQLKAEATAQHIPIVGVSETMQPSTTTFQAWQTRQLIALENALGG